MKYIYSNCCCIPSLTIDGKETSEMSRQELKKHVETLLDKCDYMDVLQSLFMELMMAIGEEHDLGYCGQCGEHNIEWIYEY